MPPKAVAASSTTRISGVGAAEQPATSAIERVSRTRIGVVGRTSGSLFVGARPVWDCGIHLYRHVE
jgi:hypothetical protein